MDIFEILSDSLLTLLFLDIVRNYTKSRERVKDYITYLVFVIGVTLTLKLIFRVPRDYIDPFSFPSLHSSLSVIPVWYYRNLLYIGYSIFIGFLRIYGGYHNLIEVVAGYFTGFLSLLIVDFIKKIGLEGYRKLFHIGFASTLSYILFVNHLYGMVFLLLLLIAGAFLYYLIKIDKLLTKFWIFNSLKKFGKDMLYWFDRDFTGKGAFTLIVGVFIVSLFWDKAYISAMYLAWVDGLSTIFGKFFETKKKSIYGMLGGYLGGIIAFFATKSSIFSLILVPFLEYVTPRKIDDNLMIPIYVFVIEILNEMFIL